MTITKTELKFVKDVLYELSAIADPSEYLKSDVDQAMRILGNLQGMDLETYLKFNEEVLNNDSN